MTRHIQQGEKPFSVCCMGFSDRMTDAHLEFMANIRQQHARKLLFKVPSLHEFSCYAQGGNRLQNLGLVDFFICPNQAIRDELVGWGIPLRKLIVQPNGIPSNYFSPCPPEQKKVLLQKMGLPDQLSFIFTGRFAARKRVDMLVDAFSAAGQVNLLLVGYFDNRFDTGSSFQIPDGAHIKVFGPTFDILPYLGAADVFVSASEAEGMSNALLEALACGLPGLVTDIPGHRELIAPGYNGQVFAPGDTNGLIKGIQWFVQRQQDLQTFSRNARETIVSRFPIENVADTYFKLLTE